MFFSRYLLHFNSLKHRGFLTQLYIESDRLIINQIRWVGNLNNSNMIELTVTVLVVIVILLVFLVVFFCCLHICIKVFSNNNRLQIYPTTQFHFASGHHQVLNPTAVRAGLDAAVMKTIPVVSFRAQDFKEKLECSVCLNQVREGEKIRLLPKCNHGFHRECIDMWFQSHSTCPLCRNPVVNPVNSSSSVAESTMESLQSLREDPLSMNNVYLEESCRPTFGVSSAPTSRSNIGYDGASVIDIPQRINEEDIKQ